MEDFKELLLQRQSTRNYSDKEVDISLLEKVCSLACLAPSSCNGQPWKLHIVNKNTYANFDEVRKACQPLKMNGWLKTVNNFIVVEQVSGNASSALGCKMFKNDMSSIDIGIVVAYIVLAAEAEGLQTCILGAFRQEDILEAMGFKQNQVIRMVISVGYAADNYEIRKKDRKKETETINVLK